MQSASSVAVTGDGRRAVSASDDKTLKVWDLEGGRCIATFTCDGSSQSCAIVGNLIVAGDSGGRVYFLRFVE
jgi:WD40 repeat protein